MLPGEAENGVGMNRSVREGKKCEADTALYKNYLFFTLGAIQVLHNAVGHGRVSDFPEKNALRRLNSSTFLAFSVTMGWVGVKFPEK